MAHPPRSNPPLRSSSAPPSPCITPSTETFVLVVSFMAAVPFSRVVVRSDRTDAPISSVVARSVPQNLVHLLPPSIRVPSMVLRDGWRGIHRKVDQGVEIFAVRPTRAPRVSLGTAGPDFRERPHETV